MISEEKIKKIKEMRKAGKTYVEIGLELDLSTSIVEDIVKNKYSIQHKNKKKEEEIDIDNDMINKRKFTQMKIEVLNDDYIYFTKIRDDLKKKYGTVSDTLVLHKLLEVYQKFNEIDEENKKLKIMLKRALK